MNSALARLNLNYECSSQSGNRPNPLAATTTLRHVSGVLPVINAPLVQRFKHAHRRRRRRRRVGV